MFESRVKSKMIISLIVVVFLFAGCSGKYEVLYRNITKEESAKITSILTDKGVNWQYDEATKSLMIKDGDLMKVNKNELDEKLGR